MSAKNGAIPMGDTEMEYIRFGSGGKTLVMLPGLGDGLRTVKGTAVPMALMYRGFAEEYTVYAFSRKNQLPAGYTTLDMARDQAEAMEQLYCAEVLPCVGNGLCAAVYTQVSDVEDEINGFLTYDRAVCKGDAPSMLAISHELQKEIE